jgi:hypothetical protein
MAQRWQAEKMRVTGCENGGCLSLLLSQTAAGRGLEEQAPGT